MNSSSKTSLATLVASLFGLVGFLLGSNGLVFAETAPNIGHFAFMVWPVVTVGLAVIALAVLAIIATDP